MQTRDLKAWWKLLAAACALLGVSACRCDRETPAAPPPTPDAEAAQEVDAAGLRLMPRGMLGAAASASTAPPREGDPLSPFRLAPSRGAAASVEVCAAPAGAGAPSPGGPDARYFGFAALPLLHDAFAEARPGFTLLTPQRFEGAELRTLSARLSDARSAWQGLATAEQVRAKLGPGSELLGDGAGEPEARALRDAAASLATELRDLADEASRSGRALYFFPPR